MVVGTADRFRCNMFRVVLLFALVVQGGHCFGQHEPTQLFSVSRGGGQIGTSFDVRVVTGNQLVEIDSLHFSNPTISAELKTRDPLPFTEQRVPDYGNFVVSIPDDLPPGRYEVRAAGRHGVSNPRAFLVTPLPNEVPPSISHDPSSPTPLAAGTVLHGKSTGAEIDFFRVAITKDQPLQIELFSQRLDSRMIGQIKLFDAQGHEVAITRGADDVDPVMRTPDDLLAGDYILAVHDFLFRGGDEYHYQVVARPIDQATDFVQASGETQGVVLEPWATRAFSLSDRNLLGSLAHAEQPASEPIEAQLPFAAISSFPENQNDAVFQFTADEGNQWAVDVISQRAGQPTDTRVMVQRMEAQSPGEPKLHDVLNVDDSQGISDGAVTLFSTDPVALFNVPTTGQYRISVRDLDVGSSLAKGQSFQLTVRAPDPGFDLVAYRPYPQRDLNQSQPFGSKIFRGGSELIRVFVVRRDGWNGAVKLTCEGLPKGVTASDAIIAPNQSQTQLTLTAAEDASGIVSPFRIVGQSEDGAITDEATPVTIQWGKGAGRDFIQSRIASSLWLAVSQHDMSPVSISLGDGSVAEIKKGESIKLPIKLVRRDGGNGALVFRARDLPGGVTVPEMTIAAENSEGEIEIKADPKAASGTYSLWLQVETKIKLKPNLQGLERAQQYRSHLQTLHDDPAQAEQLEAIKAAIAEADKLVEAAKGAANEKELTVFLSTSNVTLRVVDP